MSSGTLSGQEGTPIPPTWLSAPVSSAIIRTALGAVLVGTAALKLASYRTSLMPELGWTGHPLTQAVASAWEFGLGVWLISWRASPGSWLAAVCTFVAFAVVSGALGVLGQASCNCLGSVRVDPWSMFTADVVALALLLVSRPSWADLRVLPSKAVRAARSARPVAVMTLVMITALVFSGWCLFGSLDRASAYLNGTTATVRPQIVDLGVQESGQIVERRVTITNYGTKSLRVHGGTADCSCVVTNDLPVVVPAGGSVEVSVRVRVPREVGAFQRAAEFWADTEGGTPLRFRLTGLITSPASGPTGDSQ